MVLHGGRVRWTGVSGSMDDSSGEENLAKMEDAFDENCLVFENTIEIEAYSELFFRQI